MDAQLMKKVQGRLRVIGSLHGRLRADPERMVYGGMTLRRTSTTRDALNSCCAHHSYSQTHRFKVAFVRRSGNV
jgi:hypothetical protein